jgi:hypothetical protein
MSTIYIPWLDENVQSIKKGSQITFFVDTTKFWEYWEYEFVCAMWLSHGANIVIQ